MRRHSIWFAPVLIDDVPEDTRIFTRAKIAEDAACRNHIRNDMSDYAAGEMSRSTTFHPSADITFAKWAFRIFTKANALGLKAGVA